MLDFYGLTHRGLVREQNEDTFLIRTPREHGKEEKGFLFAVADGLGGHLHGEIASRLAVKALAECYLTSPLPPGEALLEALLEANERVREEARKRRSNMGTTLTALAVVGRRGHVVHVGDSRLYLLRGRLSQITPDHTLLAEWLKKGLVTEEEAKDHPDRHVLSQAIGTGQIRPFATELPLEPQDRLLLSTDGLHGYVEEGEIERVLRGGSPKEAAEKLIELALAAGGYDNITVIVVEVHP